MADGTTVIGNASNMFYELQARSNQTFFPVVGIHVDVKHGRSTLRAMLGGKYVATLLCPYSIYWLC